MPQKIKKDVDELREAIGAMGRSAPIVKVGETLAKGGKMAQDLYGTADRYVRSKLPAKKPVRKDINLPVERKMSRRRR